MASINTKALVINVLSKSVPLGVASKWTDITTQMPKFTHDIVTPGLDDKKHKTDISALVSGVPTVFARADLFKTALIYSGTDNANGALNDFYNDLVDEWKGLIGCLALKPNIITIKKVELAYSDSKPIKETYNIYEPKGAFGNMLFEQRAAWCLRKRAQNEDLIPFINIIKIGDQVVGGTSPFTLLFTAPKYYLEESADTPFIRDGKFTDPLKSGLEPNQLLALYAYVDNIIAKCPQFTNYFIPQGEKNSLVNLTKERDCLNKWKEEIGKLLDEKGIARETASANPVKVFSEPFNIVFNLTFELYGLNGVIYSKAVEGSQIFNADDLLLDDKTTEVIRIPSLERNYKENPKYYENFPVTLLKARIEGSNDSAFFVVPLSEKGIDVFGQSLGALIGQEQNNSALKSRLEASYSKDSNKLSVTLKVTTNDGKSKELKRDYAVSAENLRNDDLLLWPNFISRHWNKYFLYSELPQRGSESPFRAIPFVGDEQKSTLDTIKDSDDNIIYVTSGSSEWNDLKTRMLIVSDERVNYNQYKYEIFESRHPFKGIKLNKSGKTCGFLVIRYSLVKDNNMPWNDLSGDLNTLSPVNLGIDFGSTNTSVAYYDTRRSNPEGIQFHDMRVSLIQTARGFGNVDLPRENNVFFFQGQEIESNSIKSMLSLQDERRFPKDANLELSRYQAVSGGFPCFCKNLPVSSVTGDKINITFPTGLTAQLVNNMKWSDQEIDKDHKKAFLSSLLLHIYAQLFTEGMYPKSLNWSYPSSMSDSLVKDYNAIWKQLEDVTPVIDDQGAKVKLDVAQWKARNINVEESVWGNMESQTDNGWGTMDTLSSQNNNWSNDGQKTNNGWGNSDAATETNGWGEANGVPQANGWGNSAGSQPNGWDMVNAFNRHQQKVEIPDLKPDEGPIKFDFKYVDMGHCLTEAEAVANFFTTAQQGTEISSDSKYLTLCFDVGGSTTDISALAYMTNVQSGIQSPALIKQNSIRFAAQRVSMATSATYKSFKKVLDEICNKYNIKIVGLNLGPSTYSKETAPYFFEQMVDNLNDQQMLSFYNSIAVNCPHLFCINMYVTGLIMYYAGQLSYKLIREIRRSEETPSPNWKPCEQIAFAGKGSRIFEWFSCTNLESAQNYCMTMFINGFGGIKQAQQFLDCPPNILLHANPSSSNKYEVSKGLTVAILRHNQDANGGLMVPSCDDAIEVLGEDGFSVKTKDGKIVPLSFDNGITDKMMEYLGPYFFGPTDGTGEMKCKRFMDFTNIFYTYAKQLFGLDRFVTQQDFMNGFANMNINTYIKSLPEYKKAIINKPKLNKFSFVAPVIILEGMKFYDEVLLKKLSE